MGPNFQLPLPQQSLAPGLQDLGGLRLQELSKQPLIVLDQEFLENYSLNGDTNLSLNAEPDHQDLTIGDDDVQLAEQDKQDVGGDILKPSTLGDCAYFTKTASYSFVDIMKEWSIPDTYKPTVTSEENQQIIDLDFSNAEGVSWGEDGHAVFNLCEAKFDKKPNINCEGTEADPKDGLGYLYDNHVCIPLQTNLSGVDEDIFTDVNGKATDAEGNAFKKTQGLRIIMTGEKDECKAAKKDLQLAVNIMCDDTEGAKTTFVKAESSADECEVTLTYTSPQGCPKLNYGALRAFLVKYKDFWGAALILVGIFFAFFGNGLISVLFFVASAFATFGASVWLVFWVLDRVGTEPSDVVEWIIVGCCVLLGCLVGFFFYKHRPLGLALLSACGGIALGFLLNVTFFIKEDWQYYGIIAACAILLGLLTYFLQETVIIFMTSLLGAYAVVRGVSLYAGGFPSEMELHDEIKAGTIDWASFPKVFYAYLGGIALLFGASAFYQFRVAKKKEIETSWKQPRH